jgi:hypothetical protein
VIVADGVPVTDTAPLAVVPVRPVVHEHAVLDQLGAVFPDDERCRTVEPIKSK